MQPIAKPPRCGWIQNEQPSNNIEYSKKRANRQHVPNYTAVLLLLCDCPVTEGNSQFDAHLEYYSQTDVVVAATAIGRNGKINLPENIRKHTQ
jgi:hypothetical protein